jgi:hypothetical protein
MQLDERKQICASVDSLEDDIGMQRKKTRHHENGYVHKCLYKWSLPKCSERVPINEIILKAQAVQFNKALSRDEKFEASEG